MFVELYRMCVFIFENRTAHLILIDHVSFSARILLHMFPHGHLSIQQLQIDHHVFGEENVEVSTRIRPTKNEIVI